MSKATIDPRDAAIDATSFAGTIHGRKAIAAPKGAAVYLLTCAQNNTPIHGGFWANLQAYAKHRRARVLVSRFMYNRSGFSAREEKVGRRGGHDDLWYAPEIKPHLFDDRLAITPALMFCGEVNILPTAEHPLTGFANYTARASGIFPHAKQTLESVATTRGAAKLNYTTGACTLRNYIQRGAGLKGEAQHAYGALIVEVCADGTWFVRQIRALEDGSFQDLTTSVAGGKVTRGTRVEAIQWGDVHVDQLDPVVRKLAWAPGGMLDALKPRYQFMHDTLDFRSQNHHDIANPYEQFERWRDKSGGVLDELRGVARFLRTESKRAYCQTVVVNSNHDEALSRWLRESDFKRDPQNAEFYLAAQAYVYQQMSQHSSVRLLQWALDRVYAGVAAWGNVSKFARYLDVDESFVTCPGADGGIENGMHGHLGPNGARGSIAAFARMGRRVNIGHTHSAGIRGDVFCAGTSSLLRMNYNKGPSSWSHSHIVTYPNGCRAIVTMFNGKWRGDK